MKNATSRRATKVKDFYTIYYLVLFGAYLLLPVLFWLLSHLSRKEESKVGYYKKELRGHLLVSFILSAVVLSFLPLFITSTMESEGIDRVFNGLLVLIDIGVAGFFIWMGLMQAGVNRRSLRDEQARLKKPDQE